MVLINWKVWLFKWGILMRNKIIKNILKTILMIIVCAFVGSVLLYLTKWIPQSAVQDNISGSVVILLNEPQYIWDGIAGSKLDDFTDGLILNMAYTQTDNKFNDTFLSPYLKFPDSIDPTSPLYSYIYENDSSVVVEEYARYWHGHQVIIKPLLCLFSISSIRFINMICQILVLFGVLMMLTKRKQYQLIMPIIVMWISLIPGATFQSLQYSPVYYITMLAMIAIILCYEEDNESKMLYLFEFIGILVAFFDLLTYPLVSLGVPLIFLFSLNRRKQEKTILQLFKYSVMWLLGYVGMWGSKWILASVFTQNDIIGSAFRALTARSSNSVGGYVYSFWDAILCNIKIYKNGIFLILILIILVCTVIGVIRKRSLHINFSFLISLCIISLYPFLWYTLTINHSVVHAIFTYRELAITWYAFASVFLLQEPRMTRQKGEVA